LPAKENKASSIKVSEVTMINPTVRITGELHCQEPLYFNGVLAGTLEVPSHRLTIGTQGKIYGIVWAREVEVLGVIDGDVAADKVVIRKGATLTGDLCVGKLIIEEGAHFEGRAGKLGCETTANRLQLENGEHGLRWKPQNGSSMLLQPVNEANPPVKR
jgi:cytoskeletal protein CcmA (bactofilin family)